MVQDKSNDSTTPNVKRRDLKILLNSNAPWSMSGYGVATRDLLRRWHKDGWNVACSAFFGLHGNPIDWEGIKCFPRLNEDWGTDAMVEHGRAWGANVVISFQDVWVLNPDLLKKIKVWIPYVPIDKSPVPQAVIDKLKYAYKIITFSKFGQKELEKLGFSSTMIHEGTDTNIFKSEDKIQARKDTNLPQDAFVFGMIAANKENPPRKGFQEAIEAFKMFSDKHPEAVIFFHIQQTSPQSFPIKHFLKHLEIEKKAYFVEGYKASNDSGSEAMRTEYSAFDVLLHPSQTEGFGLCIIESQSCGTPVLIQRGQSMPELIIDGKTGAIAETAYKRYTTDGAYVHVADVKSVYDQMEFLYASLKKDNKKVAKDCRDNILTNFDMDVIMKDKWIPLFTELQNELLVKNE